MGLTLSFVLPLLSACAGLLYVLNDTVLSIYTFLSFFSAVTLFYTSMFLHAVVLAAPPEAPG